MRPIFSALLILALCGCSSKQVTEPDETIPVVTDKSDFEPLAKGNHQFAMDLYQQLAKERPKENLFFSPFSISAALAMTYGGARGNTADEMAKALHFDLPADRFHSAMGRLTDSLRGDAKKDGFELRIANAIWGAPVPISPSFLDLTKQHYRAGYETVDFRQSAAASEKINGWVSRKTNDMIPKIVNPQDFDSSTLMVLVNAIYMKGMWSEKFDKSHTQDGVFHSDPPTPKVPLMARTAEFGYFEDPDFQALEMPYKGDSLSMVVLLPKKSVQRGSLEKRMAKELPTWLKLLHQAEVRVTFPRFKIRERVELIPTMQAFGMKDAFNSGSADFSGIFPDADKRSDRPYIYLLRHEGVVDVNEEGTEAAAATVVGIELKSYRMISDFRADRPFVYLIRDKRTDSILFMGRLMKPAGREGA